MSLLREREPLSPAAGEGDGFGPPRRRRRRRRVALLLVAAVVAAGSLVAVLSRSGGVDGGDDAGPAVTTATVTRTDLVSRTDVDGTLGYAGSMSVVNGLSGTLTATAKEGSVVERGQTLYWVDNRPVPLLYGELPAWRRLASGVADGPDVRQLEQNLVALGHLSGEADETFTAATGAAVRRWQAALGVSQTGAVELGEAVFLPEALRVASAKAARGEALRAGTPVVEGTTTSRVVQIDLEATRQSLAKIGEKVEVKLPGGQTTAGTIATVGTVALTKGQGESAKRVIPVTVTLDDPAATGTLDQAPVKVGITSESRKGVLAVPVNSLLALAEGGYGVRVVDGTGSRKVVAVETGLFTRGMVEVRGEGIAEGTEVEVPAP